MRLSRRVRLRICVLILCTRSAKSTSTFGVTRPFGTFGGSTSTTLSEAYFEGITQADAKTRSHPKKSGPRIHHLRRTTIAQYSSTPCIGFLSSSSSIMNHLPSEWPQEYWSVIPTPLMPIVDDWGTVYLWLS